MDSKTNIGRRIKAVRISQGLTMEEFGKLFEPPANKSLVSKWESGKSLPNNNRLKRISDIGKISLEYLIDGKLVTYTTKETKEDLLESFNERHNKVSEGLYNTFKNLKYDNVFDSNILNLGQEFYQFINNYRNVNTNLPIHIQIIFINLNLAYKISKDDKLTIKQKKIKIKKIQDDLIKYSPKIFSNIIKKLL